LRFKLWQQARQVLLRQSLPGSATLKAFGQPDQKVVSRRQLFQRDSKREQIARVAAARAHLPIVRSRSRTLGQLGAEIFPGFAVRHPRLHGFLTAAEWRRLGERL